MQQNNIDGGKPFDWGRTSADYAKFRDIYPPLFYQKLTDRGLCIKGQRALDVGTGTGVLPRNLYACGAKWCGIDPSENQIAQAKQLAAAAGMEIDFRVAGAEDPVYPAAQFDVITACQCWWYFDAERAFPNLARMLKPGGKLAVLYMAWLPYEDKIAGESERLVLEMNPGWTGGGETRKPISLPECVSRDFETLTHEEYDLPVHFSRESWHGRMRACRGVGASLDAQQLAEWDNAHRALLARIAPEEFDVLHYAASVILQKRG